MDFLKSNKRFSFKLGGKNAWDTNYKTEVTLNGNEVITQYIFEGGLKATNIARKYEKYGAFEWVNYFENTSDKPTDIISELWDCDCTLPLKYEENKKHQAFLPNVQKATKIYSPTGSVWSNFEFHCDVDEIFENNMVNHIYPGQTKRYSCCGGRSSDGKAPFFDISKENTGYIIAIGWTGQWNCEIGRTNEEVSVKTKIEDTFFRLMPSEKIRTSSVVIMPYEDDFADAHNSWRRFIKEEYSPVGKNGIDEYAPFCTNVWGGMKSETVLKWLDTVKGNNLGFEYLWMDAGWYGIDTAATPDEFEGDWYEHTGDWRVSPLIHPQGLKDVSKSLHDAGLKFLLWFEPERVIENTPPAKAHPEFFLKNKNSSLLLNLGNEDAWNYCFDSISKLIEDLKIDCYRQDFNFQPLEYWRGNDAEDRKGITEIKHINGLYRYLDALGEKFPKLIIDNCASGGRRIDIEMLKRSIPLWRSDAQCPADYDVKSTQCHNLSYNLWMPYSGTSTGRPLDEYRTRSAYSSALATNYVFSERDCLDNLDEKVKFIKKYAREYLKARPYFSEDFYALTQLSDKTDVWCAAQFNRPENGDGLLEVFCREDSPYDSAVFKLRGLDEGKDYLFEDADGGEFAVSGKELLQKGLKITLTEKRKAKIYFYKCVDDKG